MKKSKDLSSSRSGGVFCERDYNEGLKVGVFSYLIYRYKCYRPNETNFIDFCWILWQFYKNKWIPYFHMGYAIKMHWKELFIFKWLSNCQKLFLFLKNWPFLEFSDSYQSEFVVKEFNLGNSEQFWATFVKKWIWISSNFRKSQWRCPKSPILNFFHDEFRLARI